MTEQEIQRLKQRTTQELMLQDPKPVLDALGLEYKTIGYDSYRLKVRDENTASAFISLKNGYWKYKDFGNGNNGSIVNVVMDTTGKNFKEALNYSLSKLGLKNYLDEGLDNNSVKVYSLSEEEKQRLKQLKDSNQQKEKSHPLSTVKNIYDVSTNQLAVDYLKSRGIIKIPPQFKIITGEYQNKQGKIKTAFGVGILTQDGTGADIHFLKKIGDLKTMSFGEKDISFFPNVNSKKVAIFESKIDYTAAYQQMPLDNVNIVIANSTSNALKVSQLLKKENLTENVMIFNQNDMPGWRFVADIVKEANISEFKAIKYDILNEYRQDVDDLLLKKEKIADRIISTDSKQIQNIVNSLDMINSASYAISKNDLKRDSEMVKAQSNLQENSQQRER